jgi:hypothetical protein
MKQDTQEFNVESAIKGLKKDKKIYLPSDQLEKILSLSEIVLEKDTLISDLIRILKINRQIIVQEKTDKSEIALHLLQNEVEANKFVNKRLETYEKMWDGCGCKIHYYE